MIDDQNEVPPPTPGDVAAYESLCNLAQRLGRERMALKALDAGIGTFPVAMFMAARADPIEHVFDVLRLEPGDLEETILWAYSPNALEFADLERVLSEEVISDGN